VLMKLPFALLTFLLLTGCVGLVATKMASTGYDVATDERSVGKQTDDTWIWAQIKKDLVQSQVSGVNTVSAYCHNGFVLLVGVVPNSSGAGPEAIRIASSVRGVRGVETYFLSSQPSPLSDLEIKQKIYFKMVADPDLKANQVDIAVIDGQVVLAGVVNSSTRAEKITAIARETGGVKVVKSFIQVTR
jgi:hyperosmotically inducible periplasmic protein